MITKPHSHTSDYVLSSVYFRGDLCSWFSLVLIGTLHTNCPHTEKRWNSPVISYNNSEFKLATLSYLKRLVLILFLWKAYLRISSSTAAAATDGCFCSCINGLVNSCGVIRAISPNNISVSILAQRHYRQLTDKLPRVYVRITLTTSGMAVCLYSSLSSETWQSLVAPKDRQKHMCSSASFQIKKPLRWLLVF